MRSTLTIACLLTLPAASTARGAQGIGEELGLPVRLADGEEFSLSLSELVEHGRDVFAANWTIQEGQGRPMTKGTGNPLSDPTHPLVYPRAMNRISAPDANSCAGCHNLPVVGGAGEFVTNVFVLGQRFDFVTFDNGNAIPTAECANELGAPTLLQDIANSRQTIGMLGSGFIEMLARQITEDLQAQRDGLAPGASVALTSKGIGFGTLARDAAGNWITGAVEGLAAPSLASSGPASPPSLLIRPFHQAGAVISLRQFTVNAMTHHHGIQPLERFGAGSDQDQDGVVDELSIPDVSAAAVFQAALAVPGRVIPDDPELRAAVRRGEETFAAIGCTSCHVPALPLDDEGWIFTEPNPFNPAGNLKPGDPYHLAYGTLAVDLTSAELPGPRPEPHHGVVSVMAFTDFKLHDITNGPGDPNREALDMHAPAGSPGFFAGNGRFLTGRLWGIASQMPYYHHGQYTTIREAIDAHAGEAVGVMASWNALAEAQRADVVEFLKSLQVLPERAEGLIVGEDGRRIDWPAFPWRPGRQVASLR